MNGYEFGFIIQEFGFGLLLYISIRWTIAFSEKPNVSLQGKANAEAENGIFSCAAPPKEWQLL